MNGQDESLTDYLDGRMPLEDKAAFERRLEEDPALARRLRLLRAMRSSLKAGARAMPADLRAELKRRARASAPRPSWREFWRPGARLGCGLSAAFAAALLAFAVKLALPRRGPSAPPRVWTDVPAAEGLRNLWNDDDGRSGHEG
jgi:anti-sigma factor RsiW